MPSFAFLSFLLSLVWYRRGRFLVDSDSVLLVIVTRREKGFEDVLLCCVLCCVFC
jgi:hypothetical protein